MVSPHRAGPAPGGRDDGSRATLADVGEDSLLATIFPQLSSGPCVLLGPGDDTALLAAPDGRVLATTDAMVRGRDWLDEWSSGADVGAKVVAQNVADLAAMGGVPTGLLVTLVADPATPLAWVQDFTAGLARAADDAAAPVVGGDLSSAPPGVLMVSVTALGHLQGREPVRRSGARVGDVVAVGGSLGRSAAGLLLLHRDQQDSSPELVGYHRRPRPAYGLGPAAACAGATAMIDISDGLVRDAGRISRASGLSLALSDAALEPDVAALVGAVGAQDALDCVLAGGEEHSLLACFPRATTLPTGFRRIGDAVAGDGVTVDGRRCEGGGWDHFGG